MSEILKITDQEEAKKVYLDIWNGTYTKSITYKEVDHLVKLSMSDVIEGVKEYLANAKG